MQLDVTAPQAKLDAKVKEAMGFYGKVDVLVNNAGYVQTGNWEDLSYVLLLNFNVYARRLTGQLFVQPRRTSSPSSTQTSSAPSI